MSTKNATKNETDQLAMPVIQEDPSSRDLTLTRLLNAPRELVFDVWTDPKHIIHWWGPTGFTNTIREMEVKPGGKWLLTMHGPDGTDYPYLVEYEEVIRPEKLVYWQGTGEADDPMQFHVTVTFENEGGQTRLTMHSVWKTKQARDFVIKEYHALEGGNQTIDRLAEYLSAL